MNPSTEITDGERAIIDLVSSHIKDALKAGEDFLLDPKVDGQRAGEQYHIWYYADFEPQRYGLAGWFNVDRRHVTLTTSKEYPFLITSTRIPPSKGWIVTKFDMASPDTIRLGMVVRIAFNKLRAQLRNEVRNGT